MEDVYLGAICPFGFNFAPKLWQECRGQLLDINLNTALYSLIGTHYGGDGRSTFALPDLRGRAAVSQGRFPGSSVDWVLGDIAGLEYIVLSQFHLPSHTHSAVFTASSDSEVNVEVSISTDSGVDSTPTPDCYLADVTAGGGAADKPEKIYRADAGSGTTKLGGVFAVNDGSSSGHVTLDDSGANADISLIQPSLGLNYCICHEGLYPARS